MSYTALYRKLRPGRFSEVIGQDPIIRTLKNQIVTGRVSHAYLFCGTRGTGKTSTAKIFAKAINCESPEEGEPCGHCRVCESIREQTSLNVIEIDAASNNGVDNIRDIREEVKYPPTDGKFKVYIIDEVHMLSTGAFNALLKTLEEPPPHVIFILATTDPQKIPATILSRCQRFDFRRIPVETIVEKMRSYLDEENIKATDEALQYIARISDGALRDALSLLDQCLSFYFGQEITIDKVIELVGSVDDEVFFSMAMALSSFDEQACLALIEEVVMKGRDISQFVGEFIGQLRNILVASSIDRLSLALDLSKENIKRLKDFGKAITKERLIGLIENFSLLQGQLRYSSNPRVQLEVCCIRLCNPEADGKYYGGLEVRLEKLEQEIKSSGAVQVIRVREESDTEKDEEKHPPVSRPKAVPEDLHEIIKSWKGFVEHFSHMDKAMLTLTAPQYLEGTNELCLVCNDSGSLLLLKKKAEYIKDKLLEVYEKEFVIRFMTKEEYQARHKNIYGGEDEELEKQVEALRNIIKTAVVIE